MQTYKLITGLKLILSPEHRKTVKRFLISITGIYHYFRCNINKHFHLAGLINKTGKLHLGCADIRLRGYLNVDYRPLPTADIAHDCANLDIFPANTFTLVYANAFIEHVYKTKTAQTLKEVYRVLKPDGVVLFTCIPDFRAIAQAYLQKKKGIVSRQF